jgi:hypothetical protein
MCIDNEKSVNKKVVNLERKRVIENSKPKRECIDFGLCVNPPFKSRKVYSSKTSTKSILSNSKVIAKHLANIIPNSSSLLPSEFVTISKVHSELIEGDHFLDKEVNKTFVTDVLDVFKFPDGYMSTQIYKEVVKVPGCLIPVAILCTLVFAKVINSYWPLLISMFRSLKQILSETLGIAKTVDKIQDNQEHGIELINMLTAKQSSVSRRTFSPNLSISSSGRSDNPYCLWCWIVTCIFCGFLAGLFIATVFSSIVISLIGIFCGFLAGLFIATVFSSIVISLIELVMEPQCEKIKCQLSNGESSSWGVSSATASILYQDESSTILIMPCESYPWMK